MIKILTAHSGQGGSTTAHINLCNLLNRNGIDCELYGPHLWHHGKCRSRSIEEYRSHPTDNLIVHLIRLIRRPACHRLVYSSHEFSRIFPLRESHPSLYDAIQYVSQAQREELDVRHPNERIITNVLDPIRPVPKSFQRVAGIIGAIEPPKQVHLSIDRALDDGMRLIHLFGGINDQAYFDQEIRPRMDHNPGKIVFHGFIEDKQSIYEHVTDVYHSSQYETWGYIAAECRLAKVTYHGNHATKNRIIMSDEEILNAWKDMFEIDQSKPAAHA